MSHKHANKPVYWPFDRLVLQISQALMPDGFDTTEDAESCDSFDKIKAYHSLTGRIKVWTGASEQTVFCHPKVNHAFRAWHDYVHIRHNLPFTLNGEALACFVQKMHVFHATKPGLVRDTCFKMLEIEVVKQVLHYQNQGNFIQDQRKFMLDKLSKISY